MRAPLLAVGLVSSLAQMNYSMAETQPPPAVPAFTRPQSNYLLACGGCHGENGISNSKLVPDLFGQVGFYLNQARDLDLLEVASQPREAHRAVRIGKPFVPEEITSVIRKAALRPIAS